MNLVDMESCHEASILCDTQLLMIISGCHLVEHVKNGTKN